MDKVIIKTQMKVKDNLVGVMRIGNIDYISLTDLARFRNPLAPGDVIIKWMSNKGVFDFYCLWEELSNPNFKLAESREFKIDAATRSFTMSPSRWIEETNATGFITKRGKYGGGTFAHPDIAFEFASWLNVEFKLYLIREYERLKQKEGNMRDYADILQLVILINLENLNAEMINQGLDQPKRLVRLNQIAKKQLDILEGNAGIKRIEKIDNKRMLDK